MSERKNENKVSRNASVGDTWQDEGGSKLALGCSLIAPLLGTCLPVVATGAPRGNWPHFLGSFLFHHRHQGVMLFSA